MENIVGNLANFSGKYLANFSGKYLIETHKTNNRKWQMGRLASFLVGIQHALDIPIPIQQNTPKNKRFL